MVPWGVKPRWVVLTKSPCVYTYFICFAPEQGGWVEVAAEVIKGERGRAPELGFTRSLGDLMRPAWIDHRLDTDPPCEA